MDKATISEKLKSLNLISGPKVCETFDKFFTDILSEKYTSESDFINELWGRYPDSGASLNGKVFEGILATILYRSNITPLYVEAKFSFVPNVDFDFVAYTEENGPIIISAKTSLRERYKQADLEGMMLRQVHRKAKSYLITLNEHEAKVVNKKINTGQVLGLDQVVVATDKAFDALISDFKQYNYLKPKTIEVLLGKRIIE